MPELTVPAILKYKPKAKRREIPDSRAKGLYLIIQPSGKKSWAVRLRRPDGRGAKLTLGPVDLPEVETSDEAVPGAALTLGQARELAAQIDRKRQRGIDVVAERQAEERRQQTATTDRTANSFGACVREFFIDHKTSPKRGAKRPRRWREDAATLGLRYPLGADPAVTEPEIIPAGTGRDLGRQAGRANRRPRCARRCRRSPQARQRESGAQAAFCAQRHVRVVAAEAPRHGQPGGRRVPPCAAAEPRTSTER